MVEVIIYLFVIISTSSSIGYAICFFHKQDQLEQIKQAFLNYKKDQEKRLSKYIIDE
tara:strand:+ start:289 stop:459 length:171 start_codon:yes stop_codon:yes gene_type:complete